MLVVEEAQPTLYQFIYCQNHDEIILANHKKLEIEKYHHLRSTISYARLIENGIRNACSYKSSNANNYLRLIVMH